MADTSADLVSSVTDGNVGAAHPEDEPVPVLAAPSVTTEFNTVQAFLTPTACFRAEDILFEFGSSVVRPGARTEIPTLFTLIDDNTITDLESGEKQPPVLSVFGHADPTGDDEYNKALSGRRAAAIYGMLTRREEVWESLFQNKGGFAPVAAKDVWGRGALTIMRDALGLPPPDGDGKLPEETDRSARRELFIAYMDFLCVDAEGKIRKVGPDNGFLARNKGKDGVGDVQGCGEFNPLFLFTKEDRKRLDLEENHPERDRKNQPNRRVMVLLFRAGAEIDPARWPCPAVNQGTGKCRKRFFSDGEKRRSNTDEERRFEKTQDTFACRFYQRLAFRSPCESLNRADLTHISLLLHTNSASLPIANRKYQIKINDKRILKGTTNEEGLVAHSLVPPGDYPLTLEGLEGEVIVPTLPLHLTRRVTRVPGFFEDRVHTAEVRVVDGKGKPVAGTKIVMIKPDGSKDPRTTDTNGIARWEGLSPEEARITFDDPDFYPDEEGEEPPAGKDVSALAAEPPAKASTTTAPKPKPPRVVPSASDSDPEDANVEIEEQYEDNAGLNEPIRPKR